MWLYMAYLAGELVRLESVDFKFPIALLYEGIAQFEITEEL